ncbi:MULTISPECIES: ubiquinone-dependent pyruvate dehydrogenase [unclassified Mycolicibacterium]|uniref:ubiquinone-dependent pyruvate dehydrogenase n=1 Tax=unclassified Mycolicibacterium TaxID=2636767 RepID=UPI0012DE60F7|nr:MULTISPECIES: ubiquinone-dependent pyruvate dehydrogenase [unclassified Mycolicibacterium]MUL80732.1 ubiquinone-dependent pyruvate dehydrogenase [Mycolicibacterium sp. CBMA 329]MUL86499.1 ubiquinone-dependent pyruvate dehydrogenase [Mycolicibacterium sp. CBMA 331]MUM01361.1 ubiquinone-dependent pyruvate dehydrogenase [Mycolicibacterium sp. CBMA 334]MUM25871.1 ubiquinone-dependent pyruvate dehydrogenase [Mycolicibacterium sp. CBMA 295]MUM36795.1 ubiquinone-dependent pyruvate dehydrogenase [M
MATIADHVISTLTLSGVRRVYGLPGDSLNGFTDAIRRSGEITWQHVRHEETAAFAAAADAALTGQLAVCAGSCGPGNLHLINGLFDAHRSRVPVLAIAAHIPRTEIGSEYFQETHPQDLFRECSVYCELVSTPEMAPRILEMAMRTAVEENGVAVIVVPGEIFLQRAGEAGWSARPVRPTRSIVRPDDESVRRAADILNAAERVTILGGAGVAGSHEALIGLASTLQAPIVHALRGKEFIEYDNPFDVGMTGLLGFASGYKAIKEADTLLMLGTDFPYQQFYPEGATIIQVDIRGRNLGRRAPIDLGLRGTVRDTLAALQPLLRPKDNREHLDRSLRHYRKTRATLDSLAVNDRNKTPIRPEYVAALANRLASDNAVFTCDVGSPVVWAARYLTMNGRRRLIGSFNHGTMANALPHAIGAQTAFPDRQVVALAGDGGLTMLFGELVTLIQNRLPVKLIVFNNSSLNFVELEMKAAGIVTFGTDLVNPDFAAVAQAMGIFGRRVTEPADLERAIVDAFAHDGPAVVDVLTARQELSIPPAITAEQAKGFSLYAIRTILAGRADELLDLVTTNVARRILD